MNNSSFKMDDIQEENIVPQSPNTTLRVIVGLAVVFVILTVLSIAHLSGDHEPEPTQTDVVYLDDSDFEEKTATGVVLVDFYTDWCQPCKIMEPDVEKIATRFKGKATVAKVNAEIARRTADKFDVNAYPTMVILKDGVEVARELGLQNEAQIASLLKTFLPETLEP